MQYYNSIVFSAELGHFHLFDTSRTNLVSPVQRSRQFLRNDLSLRMHYKFYF